MILGQIDARDYLHRVQGRVAGRVLTDAKDRHYRREYEYRDAGNNLLVRRKDGKGDEVLIPKTIELDEPLVAFFGFYSGDGSKGTEDKNEVGRLIPAVSFCQREKNLVRFAVNQFRRLFPGNIRFTFSLGEDSAYFMAGEGEARLEEYYRQTTGAGIPDPLELHAVRPIIEVRDRRYLAEVRPDVPGTNEEHLAFFYQHRDAMKAILVAEKTDDLGRVGIKAAKDLKVTASIRRPFKKGARKMGGSSRADEIHLGGLHGIGELFLKMMHEIEDSVLRDVPTSSQGLVSWTSRPSEIGQSIDTLGFFLNNPFGRFGGERPKKIAPDKEGILGQWRRSSEVLLNSSLRLDPLWCFVAGLYLAEGSVPKGALFRMFREKPGGMAIGFTSSEGASLEMMLRALRQLFPPGDCLRGWKVKVGNQYFPELVLSGLKQGVPMLRGGAKGEGKLRTMEISLSVKEWAISVADDPLEGQSLLGSEYADRYSHVEPTGAGVARIDFWASSALCRWYFPLLMYTVFSGTVADPAKEFC